MTVVTTKEQEQYANEQLLGNKAQHSYDSFIKGYIDSRQKNLFQAFRDLKLTQEKEIMEVKRMLFAIDDLEIEIKNVIDTGKMASIEIANQAKAKAKAEEDETK